MSVVKQSGVAYPFTVVEPLFTSASSAVANEAETFKITPNCDDVREVILVRKPEHIGQLIAAAVALQSRQYENELLCFFKAAHLRISAPGGMDWTLDGEQAKGQAHCVAENLHNAVRVIVNPATNPSAAE